jgi:hypothetical protein
MSVCELENILAKIDDRVREIPLQHFAWAAELQSVGNHTGNYSVSYRQKNVAAI